MNSLVQQLAALKGFASGVLQASVPTSVLEADSEVMMRSRRKRIGIQPLTIMNPHSSSSLKQIEAKRLAAKEPWACPKCTFHNDVSVEKCDKCKTANVKIVAPEVDSEEALKEVSFRDGQVITSLVVSLGLDWLYLGCAVRILFGCVFHHFNHPPPIFFYLKSRLLAWPRLKSRFFASSSAP